MTPKGQKQCRHRHPGIHKITTRDGQTRYRAVVDIGDGPVRTQRTRRCATIDEAIAWRAEMLADKRAGAPVDPRRVPVSRWIAQWLAHKGPRVRPATMLVYRRMETLLVPEIGALSLAKLTPTRIEQAYDAIGERVGATTVRLMHRILTMCLGGAVRDGLLRRNPCAAVELPPPAERRRVTWTIDQSRAFLAAITDDPYADVWRLLLEAWIRNGELRGLQWRDIDLDAPAITIARTATLDAAHKAVLGPPKSRASQRTIPISPDLAARLAARKRAHKAAALESGTRWTEDRFVFPGKDGAMIYPARLREALLRACETARVPYPTVHGLRHTGGSLAYAMRRVPEKAIQERLGHSRLATTQDIYLHTEAAQHRELGDLMGELLRREDGADARKSG